MSTETIALPTRVITADKAGGVISLRRPLIDTVLVGFGALAMVVLAVAGGLLTWGHNFASNYVHDELSAQNISFPAAEELTAEGRTDLLKYAGAAVDTGKEAQAYASFIGGHLDAVANGATYADLGTPETVAKAAVKAATTGGESAESIGALQTKADGVTAQRNTLFKGETLRGLLLSAFAWSTMGTIAGIAAVVAFVATAGMAVLVALGFIHRMRSAKRLAA
jgi:hypothetical protein